MVVREDSIQSFLKYNYNLISIPLYQSKLEHYKIKSTYSSWNNAGKTIILMGDVWYTKKAIEKIIMRDSSKILFFGRQMRSFFTKCSHGELFAISFTENYFETMKNASEKLEKYIVDDNIQIAGGWGIYNIISKTEFLMTKGYLVKGKVLFSNFNNIIDITDDIDVPSDYEGLISALKRNNLYNLFLIFLSSIYKSYRSDHP